MKRKQDVKKVEEPMAVYAVAVQTPISTIMGFDVSQPSDFDFLALARKGITKKALVALAKKISLTLEEIADILHISERTLQRYTPATLIKTEYTDRAIELAKLYERGTEVLGTPEAFNQWLRHPNMALRNQIPLNLLDTTIGFTMVLNILGRIEHGVFS